MIEVPTEGRPARAPGSDNLVGVDGNAFAVMGATKAMLRRAGASDAYVAAYLQEAMSGDYDRLIATSMAYLDAETTGPAGGEPEHRADGQCHEECWDAAVADWEAGQPAEAE